MGKAAGYWREGRLPDGYLVSLGANGALDDGDVISGALVTFTTARTLGAESWS